MYGSQLAANCIALLKQDCVQLVLIQLPQNRIKVYAVKLLRAGPRVVRTGSGAATDGVNSSSNDVPPAIVGGGSRLLLVLRLLGTRPPLLRERRTCSCCAADACCGLLRVLLRPR